MEDGFSTVSWALIFILGFSAGLLQIIDVLIEWGNWIVGPGNEFSTFGPRLPSQPDSYYLLKDPEARGACLMLHKSLSLRGGRERK